MLDPSGDLAIGVVGGSVTVHADNGGLAELYAAGALTIGTGNPADAAIDGDLAVTADNGGYAYLGYDDYSGNGPGDSVTIGAVGGSVNVAATSGGDAEIYTSNDLVIGDVTHDFTVSASDSGTYAYVQSDNGSVSIGDIGGGFSVLIADGGDAEISAGGDLTIGNIDGSFTNQGLIDAGGVLTIGTVSGDFTNDGTIDAAGGIVLDGVTGNATSANALDIALNGGTATFGHSVENTFTFDFSSKADTIVLGDAHDFAGTLAGFGSGDVIDLASMTDVSINGYDGNSGVLHLTSTSTGDFSLSFVGNYTANSFVLADDGHGGTDIALNGPSIFADDAVPQEHTPSGDSTTLSGLVIHDFDSSVSSLTITAEAGDGTLSLLSSTNLTTSGTGASGDPLSVTGSLFDINNALADGVTYTPNSPTPPTNDHISLTVDDGSGTDTLNVVFNQSGTAGTLEGTAGKDVIYAPGGQNTILTGLAGNDTFVFHPDSASADVISNGGAQDFHPYDAGNPAGEADHIQLDGFTSYSSFADIAPHITNDGSGNAVIDLGSGQTITVAGVAATQLHANDFLFHA